MIAKYLFFASWAPKKSFLVCGFPGRSAIRLTRPTVNRLYTSSNLVAPIHVNYIKVKEAICFYVLPGMTIWCCHNPAKVEVLWLTEFDSRLRRLALECSVADYWFT